MWASVVQKLLPLHVLDRRQSVNDLAITYKNIFFPENWLASISSIDVRRSSLWHTSWEEPLFQASLSGWAKAHNPFAIWGISQGPLALIYFLGIYFPWHVLAPPYNRA